MVEQVSDKLIITHKKVWSGLPLPAVSNEALWDTADFSWISGRVTFSNSV